MDGVTTNATRLIRPQELQKALGLPDRVTGKRTNDLSHVTPLHTWTFVIAALYTAEERSKERTLQDLYQQNPEPDDERGKTLVTRIVNRWTTIAEPTIQEWKQATQTDEDLRLLSDLSRKWDKTQQSTAK